MTMNQHVQLPKTTPELQSSKTSTQPQTHNHTITSPELQSPWSMALSAMMVECEEVIYSFIRITQKAVE